MGLMSVHSAVTSIGILKTIRFWILKWLMNVVEIEGQKILAGSSRIASLTRKIAEFPKAYKCFHKFSKPRK